MCFTEMSVPKVMLELAFPIRAGSFITWLSLRRGRYCTTSRKLEARHWQAVGGEVVGFCPAVGCR